MNYRDDLPRERLVREAADLWLRLAARPGDAAVQDEVRDWRGRSPAHERAFAAAEEASALAGELEVLSPGASVGRPGRARRWTRDARRAAGALAAAATAAALSIVAVPSLTTIWQADYRTGTGERRSVVLADGSSVMLDTASAIAVDFHDGRRGVRLLSGRAWFDVAKDRAHPFTVAAGDNQVTVTGTEFDVARDGDAVDISLAEGSVLVGRVGEAPLAMRPGDRLRIAKSDGDAVRTRMAPLSMGSWRRDRLLLEDVPLAEGIARLGRYHRGAIVLTSEELGTRRVTGVFDVRTPDEALRLMVRQHGATIREITPWLLVVSPD